MTLTAKTAKVASQVVQVIYKSPQYAYSNQILPRHIEAIAKAGFRTILALRPDNEGQNQPTANELAIAARKHQIALHYVPISLDPDAPNPQSDFVIALAKSQAPVLAFCRSGNRAARLWHQSFGPTSELNPATVVGKLLQEYQQEHEQWY